MIKPLYILFLKIGVTPINIAQKNQHKKKCFISFPNKLFIPKIILDKNRTLLIFEIEEHKKKELYFFSIIPFYDYQKNNKQNYFPYLYNLHIYIMYNGYTISLFTLLEILTIKYVLYNF